MLRVIAGYRYSPAFAKRRLNSERGECRKMRPGLSHGPQVFFALSALREPKNPETSAP